MKIDDVEAFCLPYREPNDGDSTRYVCLVRIRTTDGVEGWGEAVTLFSEATFATAAVVDGLRDLLIGQDPDPATCREILDQRMWWYGGAGIASFAASAIDLALWDIQGKAQDRSLIDLIGGAVHESLPVVTTTHATRSDLVEMTEELAGWVHQHGAVGTKIGFGKSVAADLGRVEARDVDFVRLLRSALGPSPMIMIDIAPSVRWTVAEAIERTRAFEEHALAWIEEPLGDDDPAGYAELKAATTTKIAYGEREWSPRGIKRIVDTGTVDVVGIDPGRALGVTGFLEGAALARNGGAEVNAHAFCGPITYAASLALSLSLSNCHQLEIPPLLNELYDVVGLPARPEAGRVVASDAPGLGITVDARAVQAHRIR